MIKKRKSLDLAGDERRRKEEVAKKRVDIRDEKVLIAHDRLILFDFGKKYSQEKCPKCKGGLSVCGFSIPYRLPVKTTIRIQLKCEKCNTEYQDYYKSQFIEKVELDERVECLDE
jgi:hypothetical protein